MKTKLLKPMKPLNPDRRFTCSNCIRSELFPDPDYRASAIVHALNAGWVPTWDEWTCPNCLGKFSEEALQSAIDWVDDKLAKIEKMKGI